MSHLSQAVRDAAAIVTLETRLGQRRGAPVSSAAATRIFDEARAMPADRRARVLEGLRSAVAALAELDGDSPGRRAA